MSTAARTPDRSRRRSWGPVRPHASIAPALIWVAIAGVGVIVIGAAGGAVSGAAGAAAGAALWLSLCAAWIGWTKTRALEAAGARRLRGPAKERVLNLVEGIASDLEIVPPEVRLLPGAAAAAAVAGISRGRVMAVSEGLLAEFTRTQLEAVVAHCLVRLESPRTNLLRMMAVSLPGGGAIAPLTGFGDDLGAAAVTRYPPALAAAIRLSDPVSGRFAALYFAAIGPAHRSAGERIRALADL